MTLTLAPETEARLLAAAAEKGLAPEEVIDVLLRQDVTEPVDTTEPVQDTPEQARLRAALFQVIAKAQALANEPTQKEIQEGEWEQALEERMYGEIITEKYREQGFHLP